MQKSGRERREAAEERKGNDAEEKIGVDGEKSHSFVDTGGRADI